jgi:hypothetical protein
MFLIPEIQSRGRNSTSREAKQICPAVIPVQARRRLYTEYHERMLAAVDACVPGLS